MFWAALVPTRGPDGELPPGSGRRPLRAGTLIMLLFLGSLLAGFAALFFAYFWFRLDAPIWPPPDTPPLPRTLWLSTLLMLAGSGALHAACRGARADRPALMRRALLAALALAVAFVVSQALALYKILAQQVSTERNKFVAVLYVLIGLHALHVLGGIVPLAITTTRAFRGRYSAGAFAGVWYCALYWHFVDAVWLAMFALLVLAP